MGAGVCVCGGYLAAYPPLYELGWVYFGCTCNYATVAGALTGPDTELIV